MKMSTELSTEEKIKEAAKRVFLAKGFDGCSLREIAKEAGMNVALVNYYFRSKSQLFQLVFQAVMEDFLAAMVEVFSADLSLQSKVRIFIEREFDFLSKHPEIPGFIINEITRKESCAIDKINMMEKVASTGIFQQCTEAQQKGEMIKLDLVSLTILIMSNCHYPHMARPFMQEIHQLTDEKYEQHLMLHKQYVTEMIMGYLFPKK